MILLWTPVTLSAVGASIFAAVFGVLVSHRKPEPVEHDAEREIQRLTQKLRQPWRATLASADGNQLTATEAPLPSTAPRPREMETVVPNGVADTPVTVRLWTDAP